MPMVIGLPVSGLASFHRGSSRRPCSAILQAATKARACLLSFVVAAHLAQPILAVEADDLPARELFRADRIAAWCIVPFDDEPRSPAERMSMLARLGLGRYAYDYRAEHVPQFDEEMRQLKAAGIELVGWWFPTELNHEARLILDVLERHGIRTSLWVTGGGEPTTDEADQRARVESEADRIRPIAEAAAAIGCTVGLYNHGGWFGEPENQIAVIESLGLRNVGIVYNQHHGHAHVGRWRELLQRMRPYLTMLNLNGMFSGPEAASHAIAPVGQGDLDLELLTAIHESGYRGPFGILNHTQLDAEERLRDNLAGLAWASAWIDGERSAPRPVMMTWAGLQPSPDAVALAAEAAASGDASRGAQVFARHTLACLSCHRIGEHGGSVGPTLDRVGLDRSIEALADALLHPHREVDPAYRAVAVVAADGRVIRGYRQPDTAGSIVIRDPVGNVTVAVSHDDVEQVEFLGSLMPERLLDTLPDIDRRDLVRFLKDLGRHEAISAEATTAILRQVHLGVPADFTWDRRPLDAVAHPDWEHHVNRDRVYDFYEKQARFFRDVCPRPVLLPHYPGLDGEKYGHWGNQNEASWRSNQWNEMTAGSLQSGVLHAFGTTVPRAVCVQLGDGLSACFDPDTLTYPVVWRDGFLSYSDVRAGFLGGMTAVGTPLAHDVEQPSVIGSFRYEGFCRHGRDVGFLYSRDGVRYLDVPGTQDGRFVHEVAPLATHPRRHYLEGSSPQWPEVIETKGTCGTGTPFAVDRLTLPFPNPWNALLYCGGHDFVADDAIAVCTMQGDVWRVDGIDAGLERLRWRRIAAGLHQPLGLVVVDGAIHVLGRDQVTRLHDLNADGETDFYECFSNAYVTSPGGHDFIAGLERDVEGRFLTASSNQGLLRISADGRAVEVLATGLRNPDGIGLLPDGTVTVANSEGDWVPASMIAAVRPHGEPTPPHFGHEGPRDGRPPALPMVYLPRGIDNSAGGQVWCPQGTLGPLGGQLVHLSFGAGTAMLVLRDEVRGQLQGGFVPLPVSFRSGAHRGRVSTSDGHLYVCGMGGWGTYTPDPGCLERVRFTAGEAAWPVGFHVHENGIVVRFTSPVDPVIIGDPARQFAQCWNYRYSGGYGSSEFSAKHEGVRGHDHLVIRSSHVFDGGHAVFFEIPEIAPVNQLHLCLETSPGRHCDLLFTVHALDESFVASGVAPRTTPLPPHPILADIARLGGREPNPFEPALENARDIELVVGQNLSFVPRTIEVAVGEAVRLTLVNPDVVPHNWALVAAGSLARVGAEVNAMVTDPDAVARQYVPRSEDVLAYTDVVSPRGRHTIHFTAPRVAGRYPFLCTFPGHWMVMNGELVVR